MDQHSIQEGVEILAAAHAAETRGKHQPDESLGSSPEFVSYHGSDVTCNHLQSSSCYIRICKNKKTQGLRLTFQLASPVASDRFDSLAKTKFKLARYSNIHHRIKSSKCYPV